MDTLRWVGILLVAGLVILFFFSLVAPREEMGEVNLGMACSAEVHTERFAPNTFFKTFVCNDYLANTRNCYHLEVEDGVCVKLYRYWYNLESN